MNHCCFIILFTHNKRFNTIIILLILNYLNKNIYLFLFINENKNDIKKHFKKISQIMNDALNL